MSEESNRVFLIRVELLLVAAACLCTEGGMLEVGMSKLLLWGLPRGGLAELLLVVE